MASGRWLRSFDYKGRLLSDRRQVGFHRERCRRRHPFCSIARIHRRWFRTALPTRFALRGAACRGAGRAPEIAGAPGGAEAPDGGTFAMTGNRRQRGRRLKATMTPDECRALQRLADVSARHRRDLDARPRLHARVDRRPCAGRGLATVVTDTARIGGQTIKVELVMITERGPQRDRKLIDRTHDCQKPNDGCSAQERASCGRR